MTNNSEKCPIIGILCVDIPERLQRKFGQQYDSYISASYVKFLESAGARIVPVWIGKEYSYYENILKKINGILLPGGAAWLDNTYGDEGKYSTSGKIIYRIASRMNLLGNYFPILGVCLGYELMLFIAAGDVDLREDCCAMNQSLPLTFTPEYKNSRMFYQCPKDIYQILKKEPVTFNYHQLCITRKSLQIFQIDKDWLVTTVNKDQNGLEFISTIENSSYPFYGLQFHPEKPSYEYSPNERISHTTNAIKASQYFANFFVAETKRNHNSFNTRHDENCHLIYNFPVTFTGLVGSRWLIYLFDKDIDYPKTNNQLDKKRKRLSSNF